MKRSIFKQFYITLILIIVLQAFMLAYLFSSFYRAAAEDVKSLGESNLAGQAAMIENYLNKGSDLLWLSADSVEFMLQEGADTDEILQFLLNETSNAQKRYDEGFTGIYGYINGQYVDGSGWEPPADYDPTTRDWFLEAQEARGELTLSAPYVDAQTGQIIVSYTKKLSGKDNVLALDVTLSEVQRIVEQMTMGDMGYGFIVDGNSLVLAHSDPAEVGKRYVNDNEKIRFISGLRIVKSGSFEMELDGEKCTVFTERIANGWNVAVVENNDLLFHRIRLQLYVGIIISVLIYALIAVAIVHYFYPIVYPVVEEKAKAIAHRIFPAKEGTDV